MSLTAARSATDDSAFYVSFCGSDLASTFDRIGTEILLDRDKGCSIFKMSEKAILFEFPDNIIRFHQTTVYLSTIFEGIEKVFPGSDKAF